MTPRSQPPTVLSARVLRLLSNLLASIVFGNHKKMTFEEIVPNNMGGFPESPWGVFAPTSQSCGACFHCGPPREPQGWHLQQLPVSAHMSPSGVALPDGPIQSHLPF